MKTIICTAGTSIARGARFQSGQTVDSYRQEIRRRQEELRGKSSAETYLRAASAETNSVSRLEPKQEDTIWLLHTETDDGQVCAEETARLLEEHLTLTVSLRRIEGLQVNDAQRFRRVGVRGLFDAMREICEPVLGNPDHPVVLNATGGFKSVVPFITLFGLLNRLDVIYIFEQSETLLRLPPVPLNFDYERLGQARDALLRLEEATTIHREEFFKLIPGIDFSQRDYYSSLLEEDDHGEVMLSGFAQMLLYQSRSVDQQEIWLHPNAVRSYERSHGLLREVFNHLLTRARDPLWRNLKAHQFHSSDIPCVKPGRTAERLFCFVRGNRIQVCELFGNHKEYDNYQGRLADYALTAFQRWHPPANVSLPQVSGELTETWQERLDATQREAEKLLVSLDDAEKERNLLRKQVEQSNQEKLALAAESEERTKSLQTRLSDLNGEMDSVRAENSELVAQVTALTASLREHQERLDTSKREAEKLLVFLDEAEKERSLLRKEVEQTNQERLALAAESEERAGHFKTRLDALNTEMNDLGAANGGLRTQIADLTTGLHECDPALSYCRLPFWKRWLTRPPTAPSPTAQ